MTQQYKILKQGVLKFEDDDRNLEFEILNKCEHMSLFVFTFDNEDEKVYRYSFGSKIKIKVKPFCRCDSSKDKGSVDGDIFSKTKMLAIDENDNVSQRPDSEERDNLQETLDTDSFSISHVPSGQDNNHQSSNLREGVGTIMEEFDDSQCHDNQPASGMDAVGGNLSDALSSHRGGLNVSLPHDNSKPLFSGVNKSTKRRAVSSFPHDYSKPRCSGINKSPKHPAENHSNVSSRLVQNKQGTKSIQILEHENGPERYPRTCKFCGKSLRNYSEFKDHLRNPDYKFRRKIAKSKCELCKQTKGIDKEFFLESQLLLHKSIHHNDSNDQSVKDNESKEIILDKVKCFLCPLRFPTERTLHRHIKQKHITTDSPYKCCICGLLMIHNSKHANCISEKIFNCKECSSTFPTVGELKSHQRSHNLSCSYCGKQFFTTVSRNLHLQVAHTQDGVKCSLCQKVVKNEAALRDHLRNHKYYSNRQNTCPICGNVSCIPLKDHLKTRHGIESDIRPFACDKCPKTFDSSITLKNHGKQHSGASFACDFCTKTFKRIGTLRNHLHQHNKTRSFICEVCGHSSCSDSSLKLHSRTHLAADHKLFPCPYCEKGYNYKFSLQHHLKTQHRSHTFDEKM